MELLAEIEELRAEGVEPLAGSGELRAEGLEFGAESEERIAKSFLLDRLKGAAKMLVRRSRKVS